MRLTFKEYSIVTDALADASLEEGWMDAALTAVKSKLGHRMSDEEIRAEISKSKAAQDFKKRKAEREKQAKADLYGAVMTARAHHADSRRGDLSFEELQTVNEGQKEFEVCYTLKGGSGRKKVIIKASDVYSVREKFKRDYHGMKMISASPVQATKTTDEE